MTGQRKLSPFLVAPVVAILGCGAKSQTYDTRVEVIRVEVIRTDDKGEPLTLDVEMSFEDCPGEQRKTIRGDRAFAACALRFKPGDVLPAKVLHSPDAYGNFGSQILALGACTQAAEAEDEAQFDVVQVCEPVVENGANVGFHCDRKPTKELLAKCPWFRKR